MKNNLFRLQFALVLFIFSFVSCKKDEPISKPSTSLNKTVDQGLIPDNIPENSIKQSNPRLEKLLIENDSVWCNTYTVDRTERISSFDYFYAQDKNDIWPGNILQSKYLRSNGRAISIGSFPKDQLNYTIVGSQGSKPFVIESPSFGSYNTLLDDYSKYFWFMKPNYSYFQIQRTYSSKQALLDLGINFDFLLNGVKGSLQKQNINEYQTIYMLVKSSYFDVSVDYPSNPAGFFAASVNVDDLSRVITPDNPPAYISSVTYGRVALIKIKSDRNQKETIGASFFEEVAPCTNVPLFSGLFFHGVQHNDLHAFVSYFFDFRMTPTHVWIHMYRCCKSKTNWILVQKKIQEQRVPTHED